MKKFFLLFAFFGLVSLAANAQEKTCPYAAKAKTEKAAATATAAAKLASMDASIEKRVCEKSGTVSYVRKSICEKSGTVSFTNVVYSPETAKFVNASPSKMAKKACSKAEKAACSKSTSKKACCSKSKKAACTKSASKKTTTAVKRTSTKAKLVKGQE